MIHFGGVAQLGERIVRNDEVVGSIPTSSTNSKHLGHPEKQNLSHLSQKERPGLASTCLGCADKEQGRSFQSGPSPNEPVGVNDRGEAWFALPGLLPSTAYTQTQNNGLVFSSLFATKARSSRWAGLPGNGSLVDATFGHTSLVLTDRKAKTPHYGSARIEVNGAGACEGLIRFCDLLLD